MAKAAEKPRRRRWWRYVALAVVAWLALSYFVVRPALREFLRDRFEGEPTVRFALLWPHMTATGFGVTVEAEHHTLSASRVSVGLNPIGLFGGRLVRSVRVAGFGVDVEEGERLRLFRSGTSTGDSASAEADLDPVRLPPIRFGDPVVRVGEQRVFSCGRVEFRQDGDATYAIETDAGVLTGVPFERLTTRMMLRGDHLILGNVKLRSFNGIASGYVDIDLSGVGRANGEVEWFGLEAERVWRTYDLPYAEKRRGDLAGRMVFSTTRFDLMDLKGTGKVTMKRASFFSPLSFKVFFVLKIPAAQEAPINRAEIAFSFEKGIAYVERARAYAREFDLRIRGLVTFDGKVDFEVDHAGTTVAVRGPLEDPTIKVLPLDALTLPFDRLFREKVAAR